MTQPPTHRTIAFVSVALFLAAFVPTLRILTNLWWNDEDLGHCTLVPAVMVWMIWRDRAQWQSSQLQPSWWGFPVLALGATMQALALMGMGAFLGSLSLLVSLLGGVLAFGGFRLVRAWALPLLMSLFMLPKLVLVYNQITLPLQLLATRLAAGMLALMGVAAEQQGNLLSVTGRQVVVAEACNGMRYVLSLGFMAVMLAYLADFRPRLRWLMLAASLPVAILGNALRVAAVGYSPALQAGTPHVIAGWAIFLVCLALLGGVCQIFGSIRRPA